jgi:DNA (cytosine-5)-methyltransferase 1
MRYGSLFSGIEAATVAFQPLGWEAGWFAEIEPFCCRVLKERFPAVNNLGDVMGIESASAVDLIIGGSPCPSFSVAGKRRGLEDARGKLTLRYIEIINLLKPRWFIWENVPGVLSSDNGNDFKVVLDEMVKCGYGVSWRVLDARGFGLPQSRKRLYVVGRYGRECPREVLFESSDVCNDFAAHGRKWTTDTFKDKGMDVIPMCFRGRDGRTVMELMDYFGCLRSVGGFCRNYVWDGKNIRLLTPVECERLQGLPDNHTLIEGCSDMERWRAIGNSMAVPVIRWLGEGIQAVERGESFLVESS